MPDIPFISTKPRRCHGSVASSPIYRRMPPDDRLCAALAPYAALGVPGRGADVHVVLHDSWHGP